MITFKLNILLYFAKKPEATPSKIRTTNKHGIGKNITIIKKRISSESIIIENNTTTTNFGPDNLIGAATIQYELFPNKPSYEAEILCYSGCVAKVVSRDMQTIIKTRQDEHGIWVPVCIEHFIDQLNLEEIKKLHQHIMEIRINTANSKLSSWMRFVLDNAQISDTVDFQEVQVNSTAGQCSMDSMRMKSGVKISAKRSASVKTAAHEVFSHISATNDDIIYKIIERQSRGLDVSHRLYASQTAKDEKNDKIKSKNKEKITKVTKKHPSIDEQCLNILIPAEVFFTDPNLAVFKAPSCNSTLKQIYITTSADNLLTRTQKLFLNILVIKILKINNLPIEILQQKGINTIHASYNIPYIAKFETQPKPIASKVEFNEARAHFTDAVPRMKLIETLQNQKLIVEVYGNKDVIATETSSYALFGTKAEDVKFGVIQQTEFEHDIVECKNDPVLLMVATYDISSLVENIWEFKEKAQCHEPNLTLTRKASSYYEVVKFLDLININEINLNPAYKKCKAIIPEQVLIKSGTILKVEAFLMAPQAATLILHQVPNTFKRILIILKDEEFAKLIYISIYRHNESVLKEFNKNNKNNATPNTLELELSELLTGFIIDNGSSFMFFIEGPSTGFILNTWHMVDSLEDDRGKIFFNTDNAFEKRMYINFLSTGMYLITLKIPLQDILAMDKIYLRGKVPAPCLEALKKLNLIFYSSTLKSIFQQGLLPKPEELMSLAFEWGVSMRWKSGIEKV